MAERIGQILEDYVERGIIHGVVFQAINSKGEVIYSGSRGSLAVESKKPLPVDALCWIASMTKLFTSVAVMQLVERGLVTLDEGVSSYLPELATRQVLESFDGDGNPVVRKAKHKITLRHLLSHQSGFAYPALNSQLGTWIKFVDRPNPRSSTGKLADYDTPLVFEPGESWLYGPGLDWAGRIVEIVSGKSLGDYMEENIFKPLDLKNTTFHPEKRWDTLPPLLEMSIRTKDEQRKFKSAQIPYASGRSAPEDLGGIGLYSTVPDYSKLLVALLQDGGPILSRESVGEMLKPQINIRKNYLEVVKGSFRSALAGSWDEDTDGDHTLAGTVNLTALKGRWAAGSVNWTGFPNLSWWVDRQSGIAGVVFVQILPVGDSLINELVKELEAALYGLVA